MDEIVGELQCPICLEFLQHPLILPCAHVLCRNPCAVRLFNANFVRCPVCRDSSFVNGGVDSLPRVITLENIIDRYGVGFIIIYVVLRILTSSGSCCSLNDYIEYIS